MCMVQYLSSFLYPLQGRTNLYALVESMRHRKDNVIHNTKQQKQNCIFREDFEQKFSLGIHFGYLSGW